MNELLRTDESGNQTVDARELHAALGVGKDFSTWIKDRFEKYGFEEGKSYSPILGNRSDGLPGKPKQEYLLTISTAKEIAMVENNEQGRNYDKSRRLPVYCRCSVGTAAGCVLCWGRN